MPESIEEFIVTACVPADASHASGTLEKANAILAECPGLAGEKEEIILAP